MGEEITQKNKIPNNRYSGMKAVKTYKDFAVSSLKGNSTSLARMIIKEKKKQELKETYTLKNRKNAAMLILSIILVLLGVAVVVGIVLFAMTKNSELSEKNSSILPKSVIQYDYKTEVDITDMDRRDIVKVFKKTIKETVIPIGDIKILSFVNRDEEGYKKLATSRDLIEKLDTRMPIQLKRSFYKNFTAGVLSADTALPFLIFKLNSFDIAYVKMMEWEKAMLYDIGSLFNIDKIYFSQHFNDLSLFNNDARVILDTEGSVIFGYSFIDLNTLVFFTDSSTFKSLKSAIQSYKERF